MAATKRNMNVRASQFAITGGATISLTGVTNFGYDYGGSTQDFSGDADRYPTTIVNDMNVPSVSVTTADLAAANSLPPGTRGTYSCTVKDAKNPSSSALSGDIAVTLSNAIVSTNSATAAHRSFSSANLSIKAESTDGATNPLAFSVTA